jgi:signal transduction histidine kinase
MGGQQLINTRTERGAPLPKVELDPAYVAAMREGRTFVSNLIPGMLVRSPIIHIAQPYMHPSGEIYGLSVVMEPATLGESLNVARFAPDGVLALIDRAGFVIVRNPSQEQFMGRSATPDIVKATREQEEAVLESVTLEGIAVLTALSRTKCGWSVVIGTPKSKVLASARTLLLLAVGSSLAVTGFAIGIALWIGRAVVRSVDTLARDAELMASGKMPMSKPTELQETRLVGEAMLRMAQALAEELKAKTAAEAELRVARDRLSDYAQELEKRVEERTASLREAVAQMEEFSYTVSHDLRSPLRAISGYAMALLEDCGPRLDETSRDHLERILRASKRMDQLTIDVLKYSRVARADVQCEAVDVEQTVRSAVEHYSELNPAAVDITLLTPMHAVLAHEPSLAQALANLLTNAAKFVKPGDRPQITVRTEKRGDRVRVWVEDQGIGISKKDQSRLFGIFERAANTKAYAGTGMGLAIVRKAVEKMGGACGVESDGAFGSRFWIELNAAVFLPLPGKAGSR